MADRSVTRTSLIPVVEANPVIVLQDESVREGFLAEIEREVRSHVPDLTTKKGRDAIASLAYKVAKTKAPIDDAGKALTEEARATIDKVNAARKLVRDRLDALKDEARKPLTDWEAAEAKREADYKEALGALQGMRVVSLDATSALVAEALAAAREAEFTVEKFGDLAELLEPERAKTVEVLEAAHARILREEADRAELERLRKEASERAENEARAERERQAEEERKAAIARAAEEAAAAAREEERQKAEAAIAAERAAREKAEQDVRDAEEKAAREKEEAEQARRAAEVAEIARREQEAAEERRRQQDQAHRSAVMRAAKEAIMRHGETDEETAKRIVLAIVAGSVPAVRISF